jgi:hypothetical protein
MHSSGDKNVSSDQPVNPMPNLETDKPKSHLLD